MNIPRVANDFHLTHSYYEAQKHIVPGSVTIIHGITGSGKTQICARLALEFKRDKSSKVYFMDAKTIYSLNEDIDKIFKVAKENVIPDTKTTSLLPEFLQWLKSPNDSGNKNIMILDGVENDMVLEEILDRLEDAEWQEHLNNTSVVVNSQLAPHRECHDSFYIMHVYEFTKEEAQGYLKIPANVLLEDLNISFLPRSLHQLKEFIRSSYMKNDAGKIKQFISDMEERPKNYMALNSIKECLEKLPHELLWVLKHLTVFCRNNITITEELIDALGLEDKLSVVINAVVRRSYGYIQTKDNSETGRSFMILYPLVIKAIQLLEENEERPEIFRNSLLAFCRIMPRNNRHHQSDLASNSLENALNLYKNYKKMTKSCTVDELTKLLSAELHISIGVCMMSHRHNITDVMTNLYEGKKLFLDILFQGSFDSKNVEQEINSRLANGGNFKLSDHLYVQSVTDKAYINQLQQMQRLSHEDLETFFHGSKKGKNYRMCDHLSLSGLNKLKKRKKLLDIEKLAHIYLLELFAQLMHLLSKSYSKAREHIKAKEVSEVADAIYRSIKEHCGVTLLGMYINRRFLYTVRAELEDLKGKETLREDWEKLRREPSGTVYEYGIAKCMNISEDAHHLLICYEGEMLVCGYIASDSLCEPMMKNNYLESGRYLMGEIDTLCSNIKHPFITSRDISRACIAKSKYYQLCANLQKALSCSIGSMIAYNKYWLHKLGLECGHPELEDVKIQKFIDCYNQLNSWLKEYKGNGQTKIGPIPLNDEEKKYLENVGQAWEKKCKITQDGGDKRFSAITEILAISTVDVCSQ